MVYLDMSAHNRSMRISAFAAVVALAAAISSPAVEAGTWVGGGGVYVGGGYGYGGGRWVGSPYRPWYGPGYGYAGWRYGYPGFGYGLGYGFGYGTGWALAASSPWYWGGPPAFYAVPPLLPFAVVAEPALAFEVSPVYVQQAPSAAADRAAPTARQRAGSWYYCTEPAGYHPYVQQCSRPWIAVEPTSVPAAAAP